MSAPLFIHASAFQREQEILRGDDRAGLHQYVRDLGVSGAVDGGFHFYGFDAQQALAGFDGFAFLDRYGRDLAGHGGGDVVGVFGVGLGVLVEAGFERAVGNDDFARLAV